MGASAQKGTNKPFKSILVEAFLHLQKQSNGNSWPTTGHFLQIHISLKMSNNEQSFHLFMLLTGLTVFEKQSIHSPCLKLISRVDSFGWEHAVILHEKDGRLKCWQIVPTVAG